uniref:Uncharacterized protein n=1 Tax=Physcomitrium patens TaxID=3218 RepID=A0A7I4BW69_PHYPA
MQFTKLDDSPMFRKQLQALEESAEALRERCQRFYKGCRKYTDGLGEAYDGDIAFANALETFGGGHDDPISVAVGGPVMTRFTIALREIGTYKEILRSQVEHMLNDRLTQFVSIDLQDVKVREKCLSLKKDAKPEIISEFEEDLRNAKSQFEEARFNLMTALSNIEAKKKFEFLEAVSGSMDAHLRYFKQGYELLHQMEPYIHQVLAYAQQSRERANSEQVLLADRMQEYRQQMERDNQRSLSVDTTTGGDGIQAVGRSSHKMIEAVMQSTPRGKIQTIKQGYILKRSSNLRGDWKRRFFVLDSRGMLYYFRKQWGKPSDDKTIAHHTVNLLTSTIKIDAEQSELRFCFRIISPSKTFTLQAENAIDRMDWMDKITGVIASLLNNQISDQRPFRNSMGLHQRTGSESSTLSAASSSEYDGCEDTASSRPFSSDSHRDHIPRRGPKLKQQERPLDILQKVPGNGICADCGASDPDWASLNLGILLCIECSGVHRNLSVQISKVRSLTLDVRVWEPSVIGYFQSVGNAYANTIWEELLTSDFRDTEDIRDKGVRDERNGFTKDVRVKPKANDPIAVKEKFIHAKYVERRFIRKWKPQSGVPPVARQVWDAVWTNKPQLVLRLLITADANVNTTLEQAMGATEWSRFSLTNLTGVLSRKGSVSSSSRGNWSGPLLSTSQDFPRPHSAVSSPLRGSDLAEDPSHRDGSIQDFKDFQGCTLLHVASQIGELNLVELLLQHGAQVDIVDSFGRTSLHHCILKGRNECAKLLLTRGSKPGALDNTGKTPLELAVEKGAITDDELFLMLSELNK